ncbi:DUF2268 domain-containing protein [Paenibacillus profundus]|uniref:DUF2268 domain-containing protein n=1 Tax=Paenibacillus profundus TaxID=1173085 RepID=A0ABS8YA18_9BACL|nr:DUF2268 domain-containing putative Zn-dependent protease [Paenibacillus profundus]MCE5168738.1 DUF2268 domain-containing protein [Paenibacillus profundus]
MNINMHDMVQRQRDIIALPQELREEAMRKRLLGPFEGMIGYIVPPQNDPLEQFGLMRPDGPTERYETALNLLAEADAEELCRQALEQSWASFNELGYKPPVTDIEFGLFLLEDRQPEMAAFHQGYTGFAGIPGYIMVNVWPNEFNLPRLPAAAAHEFNHQMRLGYEPWSMNVTVAQYIVMEGLAEAFVHSLYGWDKVGPWVSRVDAESLARAKQLIGAALHVSGFNEVRSYIFGDEVMAMFGGEAIGMPASGGYAFGYHMVQAYLKKTGKTAAEATLTPTSDIIKESRYFE